jgi:hypothetical protein
MTTITINGIREDCGPATTKQVEQLLDLCFYYMDQELRGKLIRELPVAYNAYVGWNVATVVHTLDGRVVT